MNKLVYESKELGKNLTSIDDSKTSSTTSWSSAKIVDEIEKKNQIDDSTTSTTKTWSSSKLSSDIPSQIDSKLLTSYDSSDNSLTFKNPVLALKDNTGKVLWQAPSLLYFKYQSSSSAKYGVIKSTDGANSIVVGTADTFYTTDTYFKYKNWFYGFVKISSKNTHTLARTKDFLSWEVIYELPFWLHENDYNYNNMFIKDNYLYLLHETSFIRCNLDTKETLYTASLSDTVTGTIYPTLRYFKGKLFAFLWGTNYAFICLCSSDKGTTWEDISSVFTASKTYYEYYSSSTYMQASESRLIVSNSQDSRNYYTEDGITWQTINSGLSLPAGFYNYKYSECNGLLFCSYYLNSSSNGTITVLAQDKQTKLAELSPTGITSVNDLNVIYFNDTWYVFSGVSMFTSSDGTTWTKNNFTSYTIFNFRKKLPSVCGGNYGLNSVFVYKNKLYVILKSGIYCVTDSTSVLSFSSPSYFYLMIDESTDTLYVAYITFSNRDWVLYVAKTTNGTDWTRTKNAEIVSTATPVYFVNSGVTIFEDI